MLYFTALLLYILMALFSLASFIKKNPRLDQVSVVLLQLALLLHGITFGIYLRSGSQLALFDRFTMVALWALLVGSGYLVYQAKYGLRSMAWLYMGLPILALIVQGDIFGGTGLKASEHLNLSFSKNLHSLLSVSALSFFTLSFISSLIYLIMNSRLKQKKFDFWFHRLPALNLCERLGYHSTLLGFLMLTLAILTGAIEHHSRGFTFFHMGVREYIIFLAWISYFLYFHIRFAVGELGAKLAQIAIVCYILQIFAIFGTMGLHRF